VGASKLLEASIEVHLALPVEQDFDGPQTKAAADFSQVQAADSHSTRNSVKFSEVSFYQTGPQ
jgi:hypothetical protein